MADPPPSVWNSRSIAESLELEKVTMQSPVVTAPLPGATDPKSVTFAVPVAQPPVPTAEKLEMLNVTLADDVAA
jgi:hypothetical protein